MSKINVLSFEVANLIAAGEVVDRPASVIKELLENAIDSGADRVTVEIQRGGVLYMRVTDNGCGIEPSELPVAIRRHATSKIKDASDLAAIMTLGFRGEALAAICAVADVRIISKTAANELGAMIEVHSGRVGSVTERGASGGTTVIVENLFANVPARLHFLKRDVTEAMAVTSVVEKIALSHPEIAFRLIIDGNQRLETAGDGKLGGTIRSVYGKEFASHMLPVETVCDGVRVSGFISTPDLPRSNRNYQNFFINSRYVKTRTASAAIEQAYSSYIPPEKFPACVINIEIMPSAVDVNVHPSKLEVKFSNERPVFNAVYSAVRAALTENRLRSGETGASVPVGATPRSGTRVSTAFVPVEDRTACREPIKQITVAETGLFASDRAVFAAPKAPSTPEVSAECMPSAQSVAFASRAANIAPSAPARDVDGGIAREQSSERNYESLGNLSGSQQPHAPAVAVSSNVPLRASLPEISYESAQMPKKACDEKSESASAACGDGEMWQILGEAFNTYVFVEHGDKLTVIDKHAAHERLIFERMKRELFSSQKATQLLAVPIEVMLTGDEVAALDSCRSEIESAGFSFVCGKNVVRITEMPNAISADDAATIFEAFADGALNGTGDVRLSAQKLLEKALYQASCKAAIKGGRVYPAGYAENLVKELRAHPEITYCPHGRPIAIELSRSDIERRFKRI